MVYFASIFLGWSIGLCLPLLVGRFGRDSRSRRLLAGAGLASLGVAALSLACICSGGRVFLHSGALFVSAVLFVCACLAALFPRIIGFPLIVAGGAGLILFSWAFFAYPRASAGVLLGSFRSASDGSAYIRFGEGLDAPMSVGRGLVSEITYDSFSFDDLIPAVGGEVRVSIISAEIGGSIVYRPLRRSLLELVGGYQNLGALMPPGIDFSSVASEIPEACMSSAARIDVLWTTGGLEFRCE